MFGPSACGHRPTMASADFCYSLSTPHSMNSHRQSSRPPRVRRVTFTLIPAPYTCAAVVSVSGFEDNGLLTRCTRLVWGFCSSGQCFACGFLWIPPRDGHPCRSANSSPDRAYSGLAPPSHPTATTRIGTAPVTALRAMPGAPQKRQAQGLPFLTTNKVIQTTDTPWRPAGSAVAPAALPPTCPVPPGTAQSLRGK